MLSLGVPRVLVVLGAISAAHHGGVIILANCAPRRGFVRYVGRYVGLVQNTKKMSRRTIGVKLVVFCWLIFNACGAVL